MVDAIQLPPGPGVRGFLGVLLRGHGYMGKMRRQYGDVMSFGVLPELGRVVVVTQPAQVRELLVADPDDLDSTEGQRPAEIVYGPSSLFLINGTEHRRLRRMMVPSFKGEALERFSTTIADVMQRRIEQWPHSGKVAVLEDAYDIGLEVILRIVMGINSDAEIERWRAPMHGLLEAATSNQTVIRYGLRRVGGLWTWRHFNRLLKACDALVFEQIARRRDDSSRAADADILGMLIAARDPEGEGLTDAMIRDQLMTLLLAGHETTATTFSWALERLARLPAVMSRVVAEADAGERIYTEAVIKEVLRLRPPVFVLPRMTLSHFRLGGYVLPPRTTVLIHLPQVHLSPEMYPNPERFEPERFMQGSVSTFGWLPFGGGLHACLGNHFAIMQVRIMLHTLLRCRQVAFVHRADEQARLKVILQVPAEGCLIRIAPRHGAAPVVSQVAVPTCPFQALRD